MTNSKVKVHPTRLLRKNQTPWEQKLWKVLRNRGLEGLKFRRQFIIGDYIVDFCCLEKKLVIELDGGQHNQTPNIESDRKRQRQIKSLGYRVLRFWNTEVDSNLEGVIQTILQSS
ncbi:MAG: endonuclease domain-containing protein [Candidatus Doudnabacteria bacterium]|nr:endonuclease domain-containing protein [bacterium]MDZ4243531.1 endonuclease domain-containing protein [Candidatus Doudnabacteria bacterium]